MSHEMVLSLWLLYTLHKFDTRGWNNFLKSILIFLVYLLTRNFFPIFIFLKKKQVSESVFLVISARKSQPNFKILLSCWLTFKIDFYAQTLQEKRIPYTLLFFCMYVVFIFYENADMKERLLVQKVFEPFVHMLIQ